MRIKRQVETLHGSTLNLRWDKLEVICTFEEKQGQKSKPSHIYRWVVILLPDRINQILVHCNQTTFSPTFCTWPASCTGVSPTPVWSVPSLVWEKMDSEEFGLCKKQINKSVMMHLWYRGSEKDIGVNFFLCFLSWYGILYTEKQGQSSAESRVLQPLLGMGRK